MEREERRGAIGALLAGSVGMAGLMSGAAAATGGAERRHGGSSDDLAHRVAVLESRQEITEVLYRYARGWDRLDEPALRSCFFLDSTHQHGTFTGLSQDFITKAFPMVSKLKGTSHHISNAMIDLVGDRAVAESYFAAHHRRMNKAGNDEEDYFLWGRYVDRFERRDGVWKIARRRGLNDMERIEPRADQTFASAPADAFSGRKPDDPLYAMLAELHSAG